MLMSMSLVSGELVGEKRRTFTEHGTRLRAAKLAGYDRHMPPPVSRRAYPFSRGNGSYSEAGTDVYLQLRIFKVVDVGEAQGTMRLKVWLRQTWLDERLAWNPAEFGEIRSINFRIRGDDEEQATEIWRPDLQVYNSLEAIQRSLSPVYATVSYNGSVFLSEPGVIAIMCTRSRAEALWPAPPATRALSQILRSRTS